ncbi:MAG: hypothetical protein ACOC4Z_01495 [Patescibacteria group bacterium]
MGEKNLKNKTQNIHQALNAATSSIKLAKKLLRDLEEDLAPSSRDLAGEFGIFDGHQVITEEEKEHPVPENYASKSKLVYGDKLKRIEKNGKSIFKQVDRVKRENVAGILAKKEGEWCVVTAHGSYEVLPAAVNYWDGEEGDEVQVLIPQENKQAPFAAVEKVIKDGENEGEKEEKEKDTESVEEMRSTNEEDDESKSAGEEDNGDVQEGAGRPSEKRAAEEEDLR